jgi:hypothetical protein
MKIMQAGKNTAKRKLKTGQCSFAYLSILIACPKNDGMFSRAQNAKNILLCTRLSKIFLFDTHMTFPEQIGRTFFHACKQLPISGILMLTTVKICH